MVSIASGITDINLLDRMVSAVEKVCERLLRAANALDQAGVPYAVVGGNAVACWVEKHGEGGGRNTPNVDLLINRADLSRVSVALENVGFVCWHIAGMDVFLDGAGGSPRTRVRVLFAGEKMREAELVTNPAVTASERVGAFPVLTLPAVVQTKLTAFRLIDQVHLVDLLDVGLIDASWKERYPPELAARLQTLIDDPDG